MKCLKKIIGLSCLVTLVSISLSSCARYDDKTKTFYGWGSYKDNDVEIHSDPPLKDIISVNAVKGG